MTAQTRSIPSRSAANCANAYIGGNFTKVNGTSVNNIAEISTSTGNVVTRFAHTANGAVDTLAAVGGHLLVGGAFTSINGAGIPRMVSLSPATGLSDGFLNLSIAGSQVFNQQLSHGGTLDLVEGDVSSAGGVARHQMFMLNVGGSKASVTGWTSPTFDIACSPQTFWARGGGAGRRTTRPCTRPPRASRSRTSAGPGPRPAGSPCDMAMAFPATQASVEPEVDQPDRL